VLVLPDASKVNAFGDAHWIVLTTQKIRRRKIWISSYTPPPPPPVPAFVSMSMSEIAQVMKEAGLVGTGGGGSGGSGGGKSGTSSSTSLMMDKIQVEHILVLDVSEKWEKIVKGVAVGCLELGRHVVDTLRIAAIACSAGLLLWGVSHLIQACRNNPNGSSRTSTGGTTKSGSNEQ
jgi:hypothetical protein